MARFETRLKPRSPEFRANRAAMLALVDELSERLERARQGGGPRAAERHRSRGKLLPRERLELLLDPASPFLELSPLAGFGMYQDESPGASQIVGVGKVQGTECLISSSDSTVKGGAIYPMTLKKMLRAQRIALENRLPCLYLVESAGANLVHQAELFAENGGRVFANQARMSAAGIPQISLVFGSSTAGGAYIPGMSDYVVMVRNQAKVFLGGPPLVKMATGETVDEETLGGAEMHAQVSGVSDYTAVDDRDAVRLGREIVGCLNLDKPLRGRRQAPLSPALDPEELLGIVPADPRVPYDIREVMARLVDDSRLFEFKPEYGSSLVCAHAVLDGWPLGLMGNNGVLFSESALKATSFIQLCNQSRTPLVYLQNITGFMVGSRYEREGIVKHGSKLVNAVATSTVPQFTVIVGGSYGAGNYGMCGRAFDPRFLWSWPSSRIAVMGAEQAVGVLRLVQQDRADEAALEATRRKFEEEASPYYATARLWDDGLLDPRDTRRALSIGLSVAHNVDFVSPGAPRYGVFRM
ncbi:MAG: carboxyl transferase domain-containing protein [Candidatus Eremiobacterota bacterium]